MRRGAAVTGALLIAAGLTISGCSDQAGSSGCSDAKSQHDSIIAELNREYAAKTITWTSYSELMNELISVNEALFEECGTDEGFAYSVANIPNFTSDDVKQLSK